jgi:nucleoside-diphosphate-sugar epimerase
MVESRKGRVAITGASGFIGSFLAARLAESGWQVKGLLRPGRKLPESAKWQAVSGSLEDFAALRSLSEEVDAVIHCAGAVRGADYDDFARVNVTGLANLVEVLKTSARPPRLIHFSSLAARQPQLSWYAASKHEGEEYLRANGSFFDWTILRPPAVYGPGDREMLPIFRLLARGLATVPGAGRARFSLLHVEDLAGAVERLLSDPRPGRIFELHDGRESGYDWSEVIEIAARLRRRPVRRLQIPALLLSLAANLNLAAARLFSYRPMLTPGKVREILHPDWVADNREITAATGWQPQISLETGLAGLCDW